MAIERTEPMRVKTVRRYLEPADAVTGQPVRIVGGAFEGFEGVAAETDGAEWVTVEVRRA